MKKYKCHKIVEAEPMTKAEFLYFTNKISEQEGFEMKAEPGYKVVYSDGYVSWSPKDVFEDGYTEIK